MLLEHLKTIFGIKFRLANIPNGSGYHLKLSTNQQVRKFLDIVRPYVNEIPSMKYKADIDSKLIDTQTRYSNRFPDKIVNITKKVTIDNSYSNDDELKIIEMTKDGFSYKEIAENIERTYGRLHDKVTRMKIEGLIK